MKIKQGLLATLVTASCGLFTPLSHAANIDITGKVIASPCQVNDGNDSLSIDLGDSIRAGDIFEPGSGSEWKQAELVLICPPSARLFNVTFTGISDDDEPAYYKNTGTAQRVMVELTDTVSETAFKNGITLENLEVGGAYIIVMRARAVSKGNPMPGTISAQVQATITYP